MLLLIGCYVVDVFWFGKLGLLQEFKKAQMTLVTTHHLLTGEMFMYSKMF